MFESIMLSVLAILAAIGLVSLIYFLLLRLIRPAKNEKYIILSVFDETSENVTANISFVYSRIFSMGDLRHCKIIAVDNGMSETQRDNLEAAFSDEGIVKICKKDELFSFLFDENSK